MKYLIVIFLALPVVLFGQVEVFLISAMNGNQPLEQGGSTLFWGYGYEGGGIILPAPLLEFEQWDEVEINMLNVSPESHTIHPHGLDVDQINDGVPQTSFYVPPNQSATYSFTADEAGTFLYHCHVTTTIHLTMGMYGMIIVDGPGDSIFDGGPEYDSKKAFLFSDLEIEVNAAPTAAFPFHDITPDYFMVNGLQGQMILDDLDQHVMAEEGQAIALHLGSMAYTITTVHFPQELHATVWMSDGRPVPEEFEVTELEIYPGERFTVMLNPEAGFSEDIEVEYINMLNQETEHFNVIPVDNLSVGIFSQEGFGEISVYPNPASETISFRTGEPEVLRLYSLDGQFVEEIFSTMGITTYAIDHLAQGLYILKNPRGYGRFAVTR